MVVTETGGHSMSERLTGEPGRILLGCDYNPEQHDERGWPEDVALMRAAGVGLVTVGVFGWSRLEPAEGRREWGPLDRVLDLLHAGGIAVDLATPTASPPPWLGRQYPDTLPVDADGRRLWWGSRTHFCPSSPDYRRAAASITAALADRYVRHPAVRMWHVGNELGQQCWCDHSAEAFRDWLRARYGSLDELNTAWGTDVWSQRYGQWAEVLPPRAAPYLRNPSQGLDFLRFSSDALRRLYRSERDLLLAADPDALVTTNLMGLFPLVDAWTWADDLEVVSNNLYVDPADPDSPVTGALTHDLTRGLAGGRPWLLMENAAGAVNWRRHNVAKQPGALAVDALSAVARGADAVCFFQWRQSPAGSERFHSALLPLAGPDTAVHREVRELGAALRRLDPVAGTRVPAGAALLFDWPSWWAASAPGGPTDRLDPVDQLRRWYTALHRHGITVDLVGPTTALDGYRLVLVPGAHIVDTALAERLTAFVEGGGSLVVGPFTGVADTTGQLLTGRFPARLRRLLGVSGEEWRPLRGPVTVRGVEADQPDPGDELDGEFGAGSDDGFGSGSGGALDGEFDVHTWAELLRAEGAEVLAAHTGTGPAPDAALTGVPAITRHAVGAGRAWYVSVLPPADVLDRLLVDCAQTAGVAPALPGAGPLPPGVEAVRRGPALFLLHHGDGQPARVALPGAAVDLLDGTRHDGSITLAPRSAAVLVPDTGSAGVTEDPQN